LALAVRKEISVDSKGDIQRSVPFVDDASVNLEALHAYFSGATAERNGQIVDALKAYREAIGFDPKFVQAQMRLAWLYREEKAEVSSANAAGLAREAAARASDAVKLLAQFCFEMNASGDLTHATRTIHEYVMRYPLSVDGQKGLALTLRTQERFQEALQAAKKGYEENPFDGETYVEAERDLIGMNRYGSVLELSSQAEHAGVPRNINILTAAHLNGREDLVTAQVSELENAFAISAAAGRMQVTYANLMNYALFLDNTGRRSTAVELWRKTAAKAGDDSQLLGTQAYFLAQGALDQALAENCTAALSMAEDVKGLQKGPNAMFDAGMAAALCGDQPYALKTSDTLQQDFPRNTVATQNYVPELQAAAEIGINEPEKALPGLDTSAQYDRSLLAGYLRGMAHAALGQAPLAGIEFESLLTRQGEASMQQGDVYPMAEIGVARAYKSSRNQLESIEGYRRFLKLWKDADQKDPLVTEALARSK
jgi:serine/threonine-protein kinase